MYSNQTIYRSQHKLESRVGQICKHINLIKTHIYFKQNRWSQRYPVETDFTIHLHCLYLNGVLITSTDLSCTGFIWVGKLHWLDMFLLYSVTGWNIACSGTTVTCYLLSFCDHSCISSSLPVDCKYQKGQSRDNFINNSKSKFLLRWINATFLKGKYNSNGVS